MTTRPRVHERSQTSPAAAALMLNMAKYFLRGHPPRGGAAEAAAAAVRLFGPISLPAPPIPTRGVLASFMGGVGQDPSDSHAGDDGSGAATLPALMDEMFHKVTAAVTGELQATANEYHLLSDMNLVASDKYQQMGDFAEGMLVFVEVSKGGGQRDNPLRGSAGIDSASGQHPHGAPTRTNSAEAGVLVLIRPRHPACDECIRAETTRQRMQAKEEALKPYIDQIDDIDAHVADLEAVVAKLDLYTRRMEAQFRVLLAE